MSQRDGVVGSRLGKRQVAWHFLGETDLTQEGDETGEAAKRRARLGRFVQHQLGIAEERGDFGGSDFVRGLVGCFKQLPLCPQPFPQCDSFPTSEFVLNSPRFRAGLGFVLTGQEF